MARRVGIIVHRTRPEALAFAGEVLAWLNARGIDVRLDDLSAQKLDLPDFTNTNGEWENVDFIITLGGDGTILTAARLAAPSGIPILGVHMGRFGFIAEVSPTELFPHLENILNGQMRLEERMMVQADVIRAGERTHGGVGLNEITVRSGMSHLMRLKMYLGGAEFANYPADGVVVATPTGSTAYALSAGGPLIEPTIRALAIVPICPHTLVARPVVVPDHEFIEIVIESDGSETHFAVDGVAPFPLQTEDRIIVRRSDYITRLIMLDSRGFYHRVRDRFQI